MSESSARKTLHCFFAGLCEHVFECRLGVADTQLIDYLTDLLDAFVRCDQPPLIRRPTGQPATDVSSMLTEASRRVGVARREIHRGIGDFTLFWAGMYPESLRQVAGPVPLDVFVDYCEQGKRAYSIASEIDVDAEVPSNDLLKRLSEQFDLCAYGLREIRREWEGGDERPADGSLLLG
jgi:hypothetical protein